MKRINKADIAVINESLNTLTASKHMMQVVDASGKGFWAKRGYNAMLTLKGYGIEASAGSEQYWTSLVTVDPVEAGCGRQSGLSL
jgi:hypothetical protein